MASNFSDLDEKTIGAMKSYTEYKACANCGYRMHEITVQKINLSVETEDEDESFWTSMEEKTDYLRILSSTKVRKKFEKPKWKKPRKKFREKSLFSELLMEMIKVNSDDSKVLLTDNEDSEEENVTIAEMNANLKDDWEERRQRYVCDVCGGLFAGEEILTQHIARHHPQHHMAKQYIFCHSCRKIYKNQESLNHHLTLYRGPCEICGRQFECNGALYYHRVRHDRYKRCKVCKKLFSSSKEMRNHVKLVHSETVHYCDVCGIRLKSRYTLQKHIETAHMMQGKIITEPRCVKCDYVAKNFNALRVHNSLTHKKKMMKDSEKYHCRFCNVALLSQDQLRIHEGRHDGHFKGPKCDLCKRTFYKRKFLDWHKRKFHGIEKDDDDEDDNSGDDNNCDDNNTCSEKLLVSEGQNDFQCQLCELSFTSLHLLQAHTLSDHNRSKRENSVKLGTIYECPYCSIPLCSSNDLQNHMWLEHNVNS